MVVLLQSTVNASDEITQIKQSIAKKSAKWTARESKITKQSTEERKRLFGAICEPPDQSLGKMITLPIIKDLPARFDWRNHNGNWLTPVKDQGDCGSCWAFAAVSQVESWWKIHNANLDSMIDLSEQFILSCGNAGSCAGGSNVMALEFIKENGVLKEACFEYKINDQIPCNDACENWQDNVVTIPGWGWLTWEEDIIDVIKSAVYRYPVSASFRGYTDFLYYADGVYEHVWGSYEGNHVALIIGWDDAEQSWICKNSWGTEWGKEGYFRIKWSNCDIGKYLPFIWDEITNGPAFKVSPQEIDLNLIAGDLTIQNVMISNLESDLLEFSSWDYESPNISYFHADTFNCWRGFSWWCGDKQISGYRDDWIQYLELPVIDLTESEHPNLSFMGYWSTENPSVYYDFDGSDGCNVWLSTNNGATFNLIYPNSPQYNCQSLFGFAYPAVGPYYGSGVAGWGGKSGGWVPVEFDLSEFKMDNVIIRFVFASDMAYCTLNDPLLTGFFVDDILLSDEDRILFEGYCDNEDKIKKYGRAGRYPVDWMTILNGFGMVQTFDSIMIDVEINTKEMAPGNYDGIIRFVSNDTAIQAKHFGNVQVSLILQAPDFDVSVQEIKVIPQDLPVGIYNEITAKINNCGRYDFNNFDVVISVLQATQNIYSDTVHVPRLKIDTSINVNFDQFFVSQVIKELDCRIDLINLDNDYNTYNNSLRTSFSTTNLLEGFDKGSSLWKFEGGWGVTPDFSLSSDLSAHCNGGSSPHLNNMDALMTFKRALCLNSLDDLVLKYYTFYNTEQDKDFCYVEISKDSLIWTKVDSFSGSSLNRWEHREIELISITGQGYNEAWLRFHFISDSVNTDLGVYIDQIEIYPILTDIPDNQMTVIVPESWELFQNYPNPFNPRTNIQFSIPKSEFVTLKIYNLLGQEVSPLVSEKLKAGNYKYTWDAGSLASGVYLYRLQAGNYVETRKMILIK